MKKYFQHQNRRVVLTSTLAAQRGLSWALGLPSIETVHQGWWDDRKSHLLPTTKAELLKCSDYKDPELLIIPQQGGFTVYVDPEKLVLKPGRIVKLRNLLLCSDKAHLTRFYTGVSPLKAKYVCDNWDRLTVIINGVRQKERYISVKDVGKLWTKELYQECRDIATHIEYDFAGNLGHFTETGQILSWTPDQWREAMSLYSRIEKGELAKLGKHTKSIRHFAIRVTAEISHFHHPRRARLQPLQFPQRLIERQQIDGASFHSHA